jgi:hypothetical protein
VHQLEFEDKIRLKDDLNSGLNCFELTRDNFEQQKNLDYDGHGFFEATMLEALFLC